MTSDALWQSYRENPTETGTETIRQAYARPLRQQVLSSSSKDLIAAYAAGIKIDHIEHALEQSMEQAIATFAGKTHASFLNHVFPTMFNAVAEAWQRRGHYLNSLWERYKHKQDIQAREELVFGYLALARGVSKRLRFLVDRAEYDDSDRLQDGIVALLEGIDRFRGPIWKNFPNYVTPRIRKQMAKGIRQRGNRLKSIEEKIKIRHHSNLDMLEGM